MQTTTNTAARFIQKEQDWQNETTRYWFEVDGAEFAVAESGGTSEILNAKGEPMSEGPDKARIARACVVTDEMRDA